MASRPDPTEARRPAPRLYLMTPPVSDPAGFADALVSALGAADVAAVCLRLADADERTLIERVKALASLVQDRGVALLLAGHDELVARSGADGAHLTGIEVFRAALPSLKPQRIAGCSGLHSRHDAMLAAESGADYVMFGEPDPHGSRPSFDAIADRVAWWAEILEIPCIGFAATLDEVEPLAAAGSDFVALGDWIFSGSSDPAAAVAEAAECLATGHRRALAESVA
jgi:thiamine-phosphate pyrophosphorylase